MSKSLKNRRRASGPEEDSAIRKSWPGRLAIALCYPNVYPVAMGNLGFHQVYHLLNAEDDVVCERVAFDPGADSPRSIESGRPLGDFELVAFSVSYETDLLRVALMLRHSGIPLAAAARRRQNAPLILAGGVIAFLNPEPLAPWVDAVAVGEAEAILPGFLAAYREHRAEARPDLLAALTRAPGIYVPSAYELRYDDDGKIAQRRVAVPGAPEVIPRLIAADLAHNPARTRVWSAAAEFGDMALIELGRGCPHACRFCAGAYIYRPPRWTPLPALTAALAEGLQHRDQAGLVAASATDHPEFPALREWVRDQGRRHSVASLRLDQVSAELLADVAACGHQTLTLAPEAGTDRLRRIINKPITDDQILAAMAMIGAAGFPRVKLYFQVGLPFETDDDVAAIPALAAKIKKALAAGAGKRSWATALALSVNPFVPKPGTPFQWRPFSEPAALQAKLRAIAIAVKKLGGFRISGTPVREATLQALLARGDRRLAPAIALAAASGQNPLTLLRRGLPGLPAISWFLHRVRERDENLPWDFIDHGVTKAFLAGEDEAAKKGQVTPACRPGNCRRCEACGRT